MLGFHGISVAPLSALADAPAVASLPDGKANFTTVPGLAYAQSLRTWTQSPFIGNIPPYVPPFRQNDWPNPKGAASPIRIHVDMAKLPLYAAGTVRPFNQADWPLPKAAPYPVQLGTWIQQPYIGDIPVVAAQAPFRNSDWPNPKLLPSAIQIPADVRKLALNAAGTIKPFNQSDWPNPKLASRPIEPPVRQGLNVTTLASPIGKSTLSIQFRPLPRIDGPLTQSLALATFAATPLRPNHWANPVTALYPTHLRTWSQNLLSTTLAPANIPFAFMAWTLPRHPPGFTPITLSVYNLPLNTPSPPPFIRAKTGTTGVHSKVSGISARPKSGATGIKAKVSASSTHANTGISPINPKVTVQ